MRSHPETFPCTVSRELYGRDLTRPHERVNPQVRDSQGISPTFTASAEALKPSRPDPSTSAVSRLVDAENHGTRARARERRPLDQQSAEHGIVAGQRHRVITMSPRESRRSSGWPGIPPFAPRPRALSPRNPATCASSLGGLWEAVAYVCEHGRRWHGGAAPFGWAPALSGWIVPHPVEQQAIDLARQLRADGMSLRRIARELTDAGFAPRRGRTWHPAQVARILTRTAT